MRAHLVHCNQRLYQSSFIRSSQAPKGYELLRRPALSRGAATPIEERAALGLRGLVPAGVVSLETQVL
jgi:malate dehydrogenase (oxaloacetate-decarboxylating)(NADP+)